MFYSDRGIPLFCEYVSDKPVITVEIYPKWYSLYVIFPDEHVEPLQESPGIADVVQKCEMELKDTGEGDHCWNPDLVLKIAEELNYSVDFLALEMLIGRWEMDYKNRYDYVP